MKKLLALVSGTLLVVPSGCDPWQVCGYLDLLGPYLPAEVLDALETFCDMPHIM